ncbi:MAG TPA: hypothetical protein VEZ43_02180 [Dongiaceae bacterium]|nr:hypothetical protein [Dongiaceae bacterium]
MNKDQSYGGLIFVISVLVFIGYVVALTNSAWRPWVLGAPVVLAVLGVLGITGWIGWTMLTTPPPAPLEADMGSTTSTSTSSPSGSSTPKTDEKH